MVVIVVIPSSSFSSYCPCWTSWIGWLPPSSVVCFSSYFALPRFAVLRFALLAVGFALLDSFHHRSRSSCSSRCPRTLVALLPSSRHWLVGCGSVSDSHRMLLGCGSVSDSLSHHLLFGCVASVLLSQSHFVVGYDSVARFWLPSNITTQHCALGD